LIRLEIHALIVLPRVWEGLFKYLRFEFDGKSVKLKPTNGSKDNVSHAEFWSSAVLAEQKNTVGRCLAQVADVRHTAARLEHEFTNRQILFKIFGWYKPSTFNVEINLSA
jgi:hypothetical protein